MNFQQIFGSLPEIEASAPGRVNLLGEHTDYNDGFVLPTAIPQRTTVQIGLSRDRDSHFYSENLDEKVSISGDHPPSSFASYIFGCIELLIKSGYAIPPLNLCVKSTVPIGLGLSSSAALEVATLRGLRLLFNLPLNDVELAQIGQQAEIQYAGLNCGIMDQMASSLADTNSMLFLDTRTLQRQVLPFPEGTEILVIDSGVHHALAKDSGYNQRRAECEAAAQLLKVKALRDITDPHAVEFLPEPLKRRARHVITENNRVLEAAQGVSAKRFGELMNASHASQRDDYEVSVVAVDTLVAILQKTPGVFGARLTGGGFGGACVALIASGEEAIATDILEQYNHAGYIGRILVPTQG
ncbi:galactokinase [Gloeocapsopsis dulcis]|uniref:Galactokinase n=1 Tax=Gloeocapsopsis dulcis AAB1 = 1H9 TaxID=1433147 RepID=A0A6N8FYH6_9CHRO|nr:galactokinase [Gloeocapsopsis dulcis]MUL37187.1 galactokinase [Gloeocapsopsis dulcis AAB1 = 1H9]WNN90204.1 galactokinase [Gloeocapsopsis dulcis]